MRRRISVLLPVAAAAAIWPTAATGQGVGLQQIGSFDRPVHIAQPPGSKLLFVVEQTGKVRVIRNGKTLPRPFLDVSSRATVGGEQGLLSIAFPPDYAKSRRFYVDYTDRSGNKQIDEYRRAKKSATRAEASTRRSVLNFPHPFANHNGGLLLFGPDRLLYSGEGDGGGAGDPMNLAQDLSSPLGKLLRIDPRRRGKRRYRIPADNPFVGKTAANGQPARGEIYSYGLRNPWRFSFDRQTGNLLIADVGQFKFEEVDFTTREGARGANFGWSAFEGVTPFRPDRPAPGAVPPILVTSHDDGNCSITGGLVVRDSSLPNLFGRYIYADLCVSALRSFIPQPGAAADDKPVGVDVDTVTSFGEDRKGRIYVASYDGPVFRLVPR